MRIQPLMMNPAIAALYSLVTSVVAPFGFTHLQFRVSVLLHNWIVFNKKFFIGIIGGVFLANLFLSPMKADLLFGLAHSALSLGITIVAGRYITNTLTLMLVNSVVFSF